MKMIGGVLLITNVCHTVITSKYIEKYINSCAILYWADLLRFEILLVEEDKNSLIALLPAYSIGDIDTISIGLSFVHFISHIRCDTLYMNIDIHGNGF